MNTDIENEIDLLDHQQISIEEKRQTLKKLEQYEQRQQMTLSMYASVTNIIPKLEDDSKTAGYIVDRKKILIDKFEFNSSEVSGYEVCHKIWKMIDIP
ncbi:hypothetical protein SAY87_022517 [Trapa incisa]|uniref:Uncharacterized protein n=1 Tax=Trapa incisa TaxID=236973 RepID=A0AAN7K3X0_9MYRT|nr:hypothetical protein SAY87_022517 [Trapa incisa]